MHNVPKFKLKDEVIIMCESVYREQKYKWLPDMDDMIGDVFVVERIIDGLVVYNDYTFPNGSLQLITEYCGEQVK